MHESKRKRLESKGWRVGSTPEFLGLDPAEAAFVELKVALSQWLRRVRTGFHLTQLDLARLLRSSQSRVAKMEGGDPSVSLDLLIRSLLALGVSGKNLGRIIAGERPRISATAAVIRPDTTRPTAERSRRNSRRAA
jgi:transcriptional regulator with XRE-family HTH domain